jgi:hypothetical protein
VCCVPANTDRRRRTEQEANAASFTYFLRRGLRSEQWHSRIGAHGRPAEWGLPQRKRQRGASRSPAPARVGVGASAGVGEARAIVSPILRVRGFISRIGHLPALTAPQPPPPPGARRRPPPLPCARRRRHHLLLWAGSREGVRQGRSQPARPPMSAQWNTAISSIDQHHGTLISHR